MSSVKWRQVCLGLNVLRNYQQSSLSHQGLIFKHINFIHTMDNESHAQ